MSPFGIGNCHVLGQLGAGMLVPFLEFTECAQMRPIFRSAVSAFDRSPNRFIGRSRFGNFVVTRFSH